MKEVIYNNEKLTDNDIDETIIRTKALLINSKNEILLGYADKTYQFPGGHLEQDESLNECLSREIQEETGIKINTDNIEPFIKITHYTKNYHNTNKNRKNEIYYYYIYTDKEVDIKKTNLDLLEILDNFEIRKIPLNNLENILLESINDKPKNQVIVSEMLKVIKEYNELKNRNNISK